MEIKPIRINDDSEGTIFHPETDSSLIKCGDKDLESILQEVSNDIQSIALLCR